MKSRDFKSGDLVVLKKEYQIQHGKIGIVVEAILQKAPPLGLPKHMLVLLINGGLRKVPSFFIKGKYHAK